MIQALKREAQALASAPVLAAATLLLVIGGTWFGLHWVYRVILASKDRQIEFLERRLSDYRENLGSATPDELRRRMQGLEAEPNALRLRLQSRQLTPSQKRAILDRSRLAAGMTARPITLFYAEACSDCTRFGRELADALSAEGNWLIALAPISEIPDPPRYGLGIRVANPLAPPPDAVVLGEALRSAGLSYTMLAGAQGSRAEILVTERVAH